MHVSKYACTSVCQCSSLCPIACVSMSAAASRQNQMQAYLQLNSNELATCCCIRNKALSRHIMIRKCHDTLILIGLLYKAHPNGCQQVLLRLRPYPMRGY